MKRSQWILILVFVLVMAGVVVFVITSTASEQRRVTARATLDHRVEQAKAEVAARHDAMQVGRALSTEAPFSAAELDALNVAVETAEESGWNELAEEISNTDGPWPPDLAARVKAWLDAHQELLAQARALAARGADVQIADYSMKAIQDSIARFGDLRGVARLLVLAAQAEAVDGRIDDAVGLLIDAIAVGDLTGAAPLVISQMSRTASYRIVLDTAEQLLSQHNLSSAQLDQLDHALQHAGQRNQFAAAIANEAQLGTSTFDGIRDSPVGGIVRPLVNMNEASYIEGMTALAEVAAQPYYEGVTRRDEAQRTSQDLPFTHFISRNLLRFVQPALLRSMEDQARHEAGVDMARIAIALEREYRTNGGFPSSLDAIARHVGETIPVDPFTGQSFQYRIDGAGFTLYSVGSNLTDDGGAEDGRNGDIVWHGGDSTGPQ